MFDDGTDLVLVTADPGGGGGGGRAGGAGGARVGALDNLHRLQLGVSRVLLSYHFHPTMDVLGHHRVDGLFLLETDISTGLSPHSVRVPDDQSGDQSNDLEIGHSFHCVEGPAL